SPHAVPSPLPSDGRGEGQGEVRVPPNLNPNPDPNLNLAALLHTFVEESGPGRGGRLFPFGP
ncbi:MAG: hypothetical protein ABSG04_02135, partial [Verrucomicrobiota bacterium]